MNRFIINERMEYLNAMILIYENKLARGVASPSHFLKAIRLYKDELIVLNKRLEDKKNEEKKA